LTSFSVVILLLRVSSALRPALFVNATDSTQSADIFFRCDAVSALSPSVAELGAPPQSRGAWTEVPMADAVSFRNSSRELALLLAPSSGALATHLAHWARLHAHPSAPRFAGWCVRSRPQMSFLLRESLVSWHEMTLRPMPWCARLHAAVTAAALLAFLEDEWAPTPAKAHAGGAVFCDMQTHHWAFRPHTFDLVLIANEALHFADAMPLFAERCVPGARSTCTSKCMTRFHDSLRAPIAEFACDHHSGTCHGFDPALNVFALCKTVLVPLLNEDTLFHGEAPQALIDEIHTSVIRRCLSLHKRDRPSGHGLYTRLRALASQHAGSCMNEHHIVRSPLYYDVDAPAKWAAMRRASETASARWPPMAVAGGDAAQAPQRSGFRHSDDSTDTAEARVAIAGADTAWLREHNAAKSHNGINVEPNDEDLRQIANTALQLRPHQSDAYFRGLQVAEEIAAERKAKDNRRNKKHHNGDDDDDDDDDER
jgi:hypothetical protein